MNVFIATFPEWHATVDVYAQSSSTGGTAGTAVQTGTAVVGVLCPLDRFSPLSGAPVGLAGGRAEFVFVHDGTAQIGPGKQLRTGGTTYYVENDDNWTLATLCFLSLVGG